LPKMEWNEGTLSARSGRSRSSLFCLPMENSALAPEMRGCERLSSL
jgi:hypothetical protein